LNGTVLFGHWLKDRRTALGLTQKELAQRVGCSKVTIEKLESGERRPSGQIAALLAEHLEVALEERRAFIQFARRSDHAAPSAVNLASYREPYQQASHANNLPAQATAFIGREDVLAEVVAALRAPQVRILTLSGPPGIGKTRLSLQVAAHLLQDFSDGVFFVPLASLRDAGLVVSAIAQALEVKEAGAESLLERLQTALKPKHLLLLLDNFEQVVPAGKWVADLLRAAPGLKVLVTSREVLRVYGEYDFPVPAMTMPPAESLAASTDLAQYEAVSLFAQRAVAVNRAFKLTDENAPVVAEICRRLDGLPLAIELAAAHVRTLSPQAMLSELRNRLALLVAGPQDLPARQQTLRGAIDWSYDLLSGDEQTLFRLLGIFVGGFTMEAAEAIVRYPQPVAPDAGEGPSGARSLAGLLQSLQEKSLLKCYTPDAGEARFNMLETIREYALAKLRESGEAQAIRQAHLVYFLALAERAEPELTGPDQLIWLNRLEQEHDNLRAALDASRESSNVEQAGLHLRLAGALHRFWFTHGYLQEGRAYLEAALAFVKEDEPSAKLLLSAGDLARLQGEYELARNLTERSLAIRRNLGNKENIAKALNNLGLVLHDQGDIASARPLLEESLSIRRELGDKRGIGMLLNNLGVVAYAQKDYDYARALYEESLAIRRELGNARGISILLGNLALVHKIAGDYEQALSMLREALLIKRDLGDMQGIASTLEGMAQVAAASGQTDRAASLWGATEALWQTMGILLPVTDLADYKRNIDEARNKIGESAFAQAMSRGRDMSLEQVLLYALEASS